MLKTISRSYATLEAAKQVVMDLEQNGFRSDQITLIGRPSNDGDLANGAVIGGTAGAVTGLLAGLGVVAVPGLGPFVAVGWLATTIVGGSTGALTGGVAGLLAGLFRTPEEASGHAAFIERGGSLVSVRGEDAEIEAAKQIMRRGRPVDPASSDYGNRYWSGSDRSVP